jgi:hypothetical protein
MNRLIEQRQYYARTLRLTSKEHAASSSSGFVLDPNPMPAYLERRLRSLASSTRPQCV